MITVFGTRCWVIGIRMLKGSPSIEHPAPSIVEQTSRARERIADFID